MLDLYNEVREEIASGDAITWEGKGVISSLIRLWTSRSHASLVVRPPQVGLWMDRRFLIEAWEGEVNIRLLSSRLESYAKGGKAFWHRLKPECKPFVEVIERCALSKVGTPYDYAGLFLNAFGHISSDAAKYICSEFVGDVYSICLPNKIWIEIPPNEEVKRLLRGYALRPGEIAKLPIYEPEIRIF